MATVRTLGFLLLLSTVAWSFAAGEEVVTAEVTYVTGSSVYVSAGREEGLAVGRSLVLRRGEEVVATVEVAEVSTHRAVCTIVDKLLQPVVGDVARFEAAAIPEAPVVEAPTAREAPPSPRRAGRHAVRGRVGLRYLAVVDRTDETGDYTQPAVDLRLDGNGLGGGWGMAIDARARRTLRNSEDGLDDDDTRTRVYRLSVSRRVPGEPWGLTVGRQFSPALSAVSIFDGVAADYGHERWTVGLLSGTQPDPENYGQSSDVREHGAYVQIRGKPGSPKRWSLTTGLIGSYEESEINREFLYVQGRLTGRRLTAYLTQEVDYNRDWKVDAGEDTLSATSTFASLNYRAHRVVTFRGGYDNRRNVRLYRDFVTPATEFDDDFRRGVWAGTTLRVHERYRFGLDVRSSKRDGEEDANTYTATFGARRLAGGRIDLYGRSTQYSNDRVEGWLHSLEIATPVGSRATFRLGGGVRDEDDLVGTTSGQSLHWYSADAELNLGRSWYLSVSLERTDGDRDEIDQLYTMLTYRF
jgi:hypothetical protein